MSKINILQGDCMDLMRSKPDGFYSLAVVDVPYGIGEDGSKTHGRTFRKDGSARLSIDKRNGRESLIYNTYKNGDWDDKSPDAKYFSELFRVSQNQIIWGANHFISKMPIDSSCWIIWDKINGSNDFADCELAWTSFKTACRKFSFMWNGMLQGCENNGEVMQGSIYKREKRIHPTQKPVALYKWILNNYAKPGQTILDSHGGSFSNAIACYDLGFDLDIIELDADYYEAGKNRFETHRIKCEEIKALGYAKTELSKLNPVFDFSEQSEKILSV